MIFPRLSRRPKTGFSANILAVTPSQSKLFGVPCSTTLVQRKTVHETSPVAGPWCNQPVVNSLARTRLTSTRFGFQSTSFQQRGDCDEVVTVFFGNRLSLAHFPAGSLRRQRQTVCPSDAPHDHLHQFAAG